MMADYAAAFGGFPAPELPWRLFLAGSARAGRYDARRELGMVNAVSQAIAEQFAKDGAAQARNARRHLLARAYPLKERELVFHPNLFSPGGLEPADG